MKHASPAHKTAKLAGPLAQPAGPAAVALAPPAYGIDVLDRASGEPVFAQERQVVLPIGTVQMRAATSSAGDEVQARWENRTGLPDALKAGVENLSGLALDDVRVHYNSPRPAQLQALAYTQGTDIHIAPGQQRHLPHEAWHIVQQKQGRVRPTFQTKGVAINDERGLEREADAMGIKVLQRKMEAPAALKIELAQQESKTVIQGVFDWARDAASNRRKVGVEITESNAGGNRISELQPTVAWGPLGGVAQNALWTDTVNLPDAAGATHTWQVAAGNTMVPANFDFTNGNKNVWMRWGSVLLTEDYGDFEWIIRHPSDPKGITYYRDQLANVNTARRALRGALSALPIVGNEYVVALNTDPALGQVFHINLQATNDASSQITFESTDPGQTKKALLEGLTHGLNKRNVTNRASLVDPDDDIATTVSTAASRVVVTTIDVDMELIMAFIVGDLCHKMATLIDGPGWAGAVAANFKQWRTLFPKSHPSQIMFQAMSSPLTLANINTLNTAITGQRAAIIDDITGLFARKVEAQTLHTTWQPASFTPLSDPHDHVYNAFTTGTLPVGGIGTLQTSLAAFCNQHGVDLTTEFTNALTALTDYTGAAVDVVRSTGFATHAGSNKGFAFEDRAEVATAFPGLATTYARIKAIVNRY